MSERRRPARGRETGRLSLHAVWIVATCVYSACGTAPVESSDSASAQSIEDTSSATDAVPPETDVAVDSGAALDTSGSSPSLATGEVQAVFKMSCAFSKCHSSTFQAAGLNLTGSVEELRSALLTQKSSQTGDPLVTPGSLSDSYLWVKVTQTPPPEGAPMPPTSPLATSQLDVLRAWIEAGAQ